MRCFRAGKSHIVPESKRTPRIWTNQGRRVWISPKRMSVKVRHHNQWIPWKQCRNANLWWEEGKCKPKATISFLYLSFFFFLPSSTLIKNCMLDYTGLERIAKIDNRYCNLLKWHKLEKVSANKSLLSITVIFAKGNNVLFFSHED